MRFVNLYKILKERIKLIKSRIETQQTLSSTIKNNNKFIKKYPNLAVFAFDSIGADLSAYGMYEKEELESLKDYVFNKINTQNSICIDVGANIGNHSLYFSKFFKTVYSFEPHPEIFELLKFNVRKSKNIEIFQIGLSNKNDEMRIKTEDESMLGSSYLEKTSDSNSRKEINAFRVQVKKFDDLFSNNKDKNNISFIKLDIEKHEYFALEGMKKILEQNCPIICFEHHDDQFDYFNKELSSTIINFLRDNKYLYFYEVLHIRKWRFVKNNNTHYIFVNKILKFFEVIFFGMPESSKNLVRINKFKKIFYQSIIASTKQL